jgi:hypothetical protein
MERRPTDITRLLDRRNNPPMRCAPDVTGRVLDGVCVAYRKDGSILMEVTYVGGVAHGLFRDFWPDGRVAAEGQFLGGVQEGEWRFYHWEPGGPLQVVWFVAGREVRSPNSELPPPHTGVPGKAPDAARTPDRDGR